jgi:carbonic anhydrase
MHNVQAIVISCIDDRLRLPLQTFIENELNLYAVALKLDNGGCRMIFEEGPVRDWIFENIDFVSTNNVTERVVIVNHTDCKCYGGSEAFLSTEEEVKTHEIQLRHSVSAIRAKFPSKQVDAYLAVLGSGGILFQKVI